MALLCLALSILLLNHCKHLFDKLIAAVMTWTCADFCYIRAFDYSLDDAVARGVVILNTRVGFAHNIIMASMT